MKKTTASGQSSAERGACAAVPLALIAAIVLSAAASTLLAQDGARSLEEVIVTARYREESLQTTPLAITALTMDELDHRSLTNIDDIGLAVPNAFIRAPVSNFGPTQTIGLRGINQTDFSYAFEPAVGIYIDDVYHGTLTGSSMDLVDLERVEVLRGPQGTLFGKNSLGGAIRLISRKPQGDNTGSIEATYGEFNRVDVKAVADFALVADKVFARVVGLSKRRDGYGKHLDFGCEMIRRGTPQLAGIGDGLGADGPDADTLPDAVAVGSAADNSFALPHSIEPTQRNGCSLGGLGGQNSEAARLMVRFLPSEALEVNLAIDYSTQSDEPPVEKLLTRRGGAIDAFYDDSVVFRRYGIRYTADDRFLTDDPYTSYATYGDIVNGKSYPTDQTLEAWGTSGTVDYKITDKMRLKFIGAYRTYESNWMSDSDLMPFGLIQTQYLQEHEQKQAELQLSGLLLGDGLEWTTGVFYYDSNSRAYNTTNFEAFNALGVLRNFIADDGYTSENKSAFVHANYKLTDRWAVSGGVRYTDEKKTNTFVHINQIIVDRPLRFGDSRADFKVGLDFKATDDLFFYGQVASGFRSPGSTPRISTVGQLQSITGEEVVNYELGAKIELFDARLRLNTAVFYMDYDPRLFQTIATQCNEATNPDPGPPYFLGGGNCPEGTPLERTVGISPWFYYASVPATVEGFELETSAFPIDNLAINFSVGYNKTKVDVDNPTTVGYQHSSVRTQPEWNMSGGLQYGIELGDVGRITPRIDAFYQSHRTNGPINLPQREPDWIIGGYTLYNARVAYETGDREWEVALSGTNLTDKFYWQQLGAATTAAGAVSAARAGTPGRPREWAITVKKAFK